MTHVAINLNPDKFFGLHLQPLLTRTRVYSDGMRLPHVWGGGGSMVPCHFDSNVL